jgi:hypothetical protein
LKKRRDHLEDLGIKSLSITGILMERGLRFWTAFSWLRMGAL